MASQVICFGEVLWDVLPQGRFLGGAPLNVAHHLRQQGLAPLIVSAVGEDILGRQAQQHIRELELDERGLHRHLDRPTGTAEVVLNPSGEASYQFSLPAAWQQIPVQHLLDQVVPEAIIFGSLALRSNENRQALMSLFEAFPDAWRVCDLNLRPPFTRLSSLKHLLPQAHLIKLNEAEARTLMGDVHPVNRTEWMEVADTLSHFLDATICISLGASGAVLAQKGECHQSETPRVEVRDTVGAGDAFTAALVVERLRKGGDWGAALKAGVRLGAFVAGQRGAQPLHVQ